MPIRLACRPPRYDRYGYAPRSAFASSSGPHADWYSRILPAMVPIAILGSSVYLGLHLVQTNLARERYTDHAKARIEALENELAILRQQNVADNDLPQPRIRRWWPF